METDTTTTQATTPKGGYIPAVGRRKTATAQVRITEAKTMSMQINGKDYKDYFPTVELQKIVTDPMNKVKTPGKFAVTVVVKGGGIHSQAEAVRHGVTRTLVKFDLELRGDLKKLGFLKRDPRRKERRKFGLKKARKAAQWSKR